MILAAQMVTTVFHQYEVGMREACIESKASQYFKGVAGLVSRVEHKSDEAGWLEDVKVAIGKAFEEIRLSGVLGLRKGKAS